ncbi:hypothetical protein EVJ33_05050 [Exiguobacterium sp. SL-10]|uniref:hypothetical protein n=1 Tax=Exiguobacterium sp. SL-10 TaxID=2510962 RepID=UPI00103B4270|nr:hypothetical protein [Exiguobacterium sp. SL-10]TCI30666.1 hypothetical protein EVJ33_05050 [Exiguobacterium sp. SL-10]
MTSSPFYIDNTDEQLYQGNLLVSVHEMPEPHNLEFIERMLFGPEAIKCLITRHHSSRRIQLEEQPLDQLQTVWEKTFKHHLTFEVAFSLDDFPNGYCWTTRVWEGHDCWYLVFTEHH